MDNKRTSERISIRVDARTLMLLRELLSKCNSQQEELGLTSRYTMSILVRSLLHKQLDNMIDEKGDWL